MRQTVQLRESGRVTLDGSGNGTVAIGPISAREVWHPGQVTVSANNNPTNEAQCQVYAGDQPIPMNLRDGTFSGSSGDSTDALNASEIRCGHKIIAVWTGGDPGQVATLVVTGTKEV